MQVSVETTGPVERRIVVEVSKQQIEPKIQKRLQEFARNARINGFRPGKAPVRVVEQKYGEQIRYEVINEVLQSSFQETLQQQNLKLAGEPRFDLMPSSHPEQGFTYTATFEIHPEIGELRLDNLVVEKPMAMVTEPDIDLMLEKLRQQGVTWKETTEPAELGDKLIISFVATLGGLPFKGNEVKSEAFLLGNKNNSISLPGLSEGLIGAKAGEQRTLTLTFPTHHGDPNLSGKDVNLQLDIESVSRGHLPFLDDEFAKSLGIQEGGVEALRRDAKENMDQELAFAIKSRVKRNLLDALLKYNPIEVPNQLVKEEAQRLFEDRQQRSVMRLNPNLVPEIFEEEASKRVKLGFLVGELVKRHHIEASPDKVRQAVERIASTYEDPAVVINWYYSNRSRLQQVQSLVLEDQVVDWLLEKVQVVEKPSTFYEVMET